MVEVAWLATERVVSSVMVRVVGFVVVELRVAFALAVQEERM